LSIISSFGVRGKGTKIEREENKGRIVIEGGTSNKEGRGEKERAIYII
jgi:hypothetical protein